VDVTGLVSCPMDDFVTSVVETSGSVTTER
jgi:hypothetical protein